MPLCGIETKDIVQFKAKLLRREKSPGQFIRPATVNRYLMLLKGIFSRAIEWGVFHKTHSCKGVKILKENNQKDRYLSVEEINRLLAQCGNELLDVVEFALSTGMRAGEIVGLKWLDVDFKLKLISVRRSGKMAYSTKSGKNRAIPMNNASHAILMRRSEQRTDDYVFTSRHWEGCKAAVKRAELNPPGTSDLDKVVFHTLRHTFASHLAIKGVDLCRIAKLIGDSLQVVENRYAHLQPQHLQEVRMLDNIWNQTKQIEAVATESINAQEVKV
jgi:integrase